MKYFVLWRRGLRGPTIAITQSTNLDQFDRENKISDPVEIKPEHVGLSLEKLKKLYPASVIKEECQ